MSPAFKDQWCCVLAGDRPISKNSVDAWGLCETAMTYQRDCQAAAPLGGAAQRLDHLLPSLLGLLATLPQACSRFGTAASQVSRALQGTCAGRELLADLKGTCKAAGTQRFAPGVSTTTISRPSTSSVAVSPCLVTGPAACLARKAVRPMQRHNRVWLRCYMLAHLVDDIGKSHIVLAASSNA